MDMGTEGPAVFREPAEIIQLGEDIMTRIGEHAYHVPQV